MPRPFCAGIDDAGRDPTRRVDDAVAWGEVPPTHAEGRTTGVTADTDTDATATVLAGRTENEKRQVFVQRGGMVNPCPARCHPS
jgi:hypothetical protein